MRKTRALIPPMAFAAGMAWAACSPAGAESRTSGTALPAATSLQPGASAGSLRDAAIALRDEWLARGHTVQQLAALSAPTITGGEVAHSTITIGVAGEFPSLSVHYSTDTPGLNYISVEFVSKNGKTGYGGGYATYYYTERGTETFAIVSPMNLYSSPGKWSIASATIIDNAGNMTTYDAAQLQALFKHLSFTVVNTGPVDKGPPKIISGRLLNTTVSLSEQVPFLKASITASDRGKPGIYEAYLIIAPPGNAGSFYSILPNAVPVAAGRIKANNVINPGSPTGTWSIVGYGVCDYAFNCSGSNEDAAVVALLGTDTFTVTP